MPAAAVIPALRVCSHIVAVKTPVVGVARHKAYVPRYVHCEQIRTLSVWLHEWLSAVWYLYLLVRSMRATGGRSISWRAVECSDPWERNEGEGIYLEGFCRSRARVGVSNRIRDPGSSYLKRCRQGLVHSLGRTLREIIVLGLWGNYDRKAETWRNWRKGTPGVELVAYGETYQDQLFLWLTVFRAFRIRLLVVHGRWWCVGWPV